jgi:hypothetical protein
MARASVKANKADWFVKLLAVDDVARPWLIAKYGQSISQG